MRRVFSAYGKPLASVSLFQYLGRTPPSSENEWTAVEQNIWRAQGKWGRLTNILLMKGVDIRMVGRFYVVVVKSVLLFGSETWVLNPHLEKSLEGFHHWAVRRMEVM